jgi:hypothetical protein
MDESAVERRTRKCDGAVEILGLKRLLNVAKAPIVLGSGFQSRSQSQILVASDPVSAVARDRAGEAWEQIPRDARRSGGSRIFKEKRRSREGPPLKQ